MGWGRGALGRWAAGPCLTWNVREHHYDGDDGEAEADVGGVRQAERQPRHLVAVGQRREQHQQLPLQAAD